MKCRNLYKEGKIFNILLKNLSYLHFRISRKCCEQYLDSPDNLLNKTVKAKSLKIELKFFSPSMVVMYKMMIFLDQAGVMYEIKTLYFM